MIFLKINNMFQNFFNQNERPEFSTNLLQINSSMNCDIKFLFSKIHFFLGNLAYKKKFIFLIFVDRIYLEQSSKTENVRKIKNFFMDIFESDNYLKKNGFCKIEI